MQDEKERKRETVKLNPYCCVNLHGGPYDTETIVAVCRIEGVSIADEH